MQEIYEFLKNCETYFLATSTHQQPHVRPFGTIDFYHDKLYIQTGKVKDVSKQMKDNPHIKYVACIKESGFVFKQKLS